MDLHALAGNVDLIWDEPDSGPLLTGLTGFLPPDHSRPPRKRPHRRARLRPRTSNACRCTSSRCSTRSDPVTGPRGRRASTGAMHALVRGHLSGSHVGSSSGTIRAHGWRGLRTIRGDSHPTHSRAALAESRILGDDRAGQRAGPEPRRAAPRRPARRASHPLCRRGRREALRTGHSEHHQPRRRRGG